MVIHLVAFDCPFDDSYHGNRTLNTKIKKWRSVHHKWCVFILGALMLTDAMLAVVMLSIVA